MFLGAAALMSLMKNTTVSKSMLGEISRLRTMTVAELRVEWARLYGEESRSRNRDYLWRRLAWRVQEIANGGLSDRAKQRVAELAPTTFVRAQIPRGFEPADTPSRPSRTVRDLRLPSPGSVLTRKHHGREIRVVVHADGYEYDGRRFGSLSEIARTVTGARWNGRLWFGLTERKRGK